MLKFREPLIHKKEVAAPLLEHTRQTFSAILRRRSLIPIVTAVVGVAVLQSIFYELYQLWFIAIAVPVGLFGIISAIVFATWSTGGTIAGYIHGNGIKLSSCIIGIISLLALIFARSLEVLLFAQFIFGTFLVLLSIVLSKHLQNELPSKLRAGATSVVSTLGRAIVIPLSIVFTLLAHNYDVFNATYILLVIAVIAIIAFGFSLRTPKSAT